MALQGIWLLLATSPKGILQAKIVFIKVNNYNNTQYKQIELHVGRDDMQSEMQITADFGN